MPGDSYRDEEESPWEEVMREFRRFPGMGSLGGGIRGQGRLMWIILVIAVVIWLASGIYVVGPGEQGVVRQFGRMVSRTDSGLKYHLPWPVQTADVVDVATVRRVEIGFRTVRGETVTRPRESLMLTGDENIVDAQLFVQYVVKDPALFLFATVGPEEILHTSAEVALRGAVGRNTIDHTMTEGRLEVQEEIKQYLQGILDLYQTGLLVTEARLLVVDPPEQVKDAFHDVVRAWEDRERLIKEADAYKENIIPRTRGEAQEMVRQAEGYQQQRIIRAQGDASRFLEVYDSYRRSKDVTRERLYLESMERVLPGMQKIVTPGKEGGDLVQLLPLRSLWEAPPASGTGEDRNP